MQKKLMLALIIGSNAALLCQEAPAPEVLPTVAQEQVVSSASTTAMQDGTSAASPAPNDPSTVAVRAAGAVESQPEAIQNQVTTAQPLVSIASQELPVSAPPVVQATETPSVKTSVQEQESAKQQTIAPSMYQSPQTQPVISEVKQVAQPVAVPSEATIPVQQAVPAVKPQMEEEADLQDLEIKGIDTVDINEPKGNWLYKRIWWEKAERTYEKIKQLTDKILESKMAFFVKRNELDRMVFDFYGDLGFKQGEVSELIDFMISQLEQERKIEGSLDEKERELLDLLTQEKKNIEKLQYGFQNISKVDQAIEDALMKLVEQLNQAKYYEQQAWEYFKAINRELSDKKARELFYSMDTFWRNLNSINSYLSDAFAKYFEQLTQKMHQETDNIKASVQALSEKGISLQVQALAMRRECKAPIKEDVSEQEAPSSSWLDSVWTILKAPFLLVTYPFSWLAGLFGGSESDQVVLVKPRTSAVQE